jgi:ribonuclease R
VSSQGARPAARQDRGERPAPADAIVAVLERRGRFIAASPLFPPRVGESRPTRRGGSSSITLRSARPERGRRDARAGDLVLVQPPLRGSGGRIVKILGRPEVARDVIEGFMLDRGLPRGFEAAVEREAREAAERVRDSDVPRRDLRGLATFTIDPIGARDFDDAISAEEQPDGVTRIWVHIADVCAHVPEGSRIDREARRRATSVYVPGAVEPMLPHALSSDACSLMPGVERPAVTIEMDMRGAKVLRTAFYRSLIRSDERMDYERVDRLFAGHEQISEPWGRPLRAARATAAALQREREQSGALVVESEEPEIAFDDDGNVASITGRDQTESHRLIEHLMIAANEAVATLLEQRGVPCLYRVHERPEPERVERLVDQLASLEVPTPPVPELLSSSQAAELIGEISRRVDEHVKGTGRGRLALSSLVLRSLKQAYYSPSNLGHAGLHSPAYCHFTSPIRRYPDLVCHRALLSAVGGGEAAPRAGEMAELGSWTSEREREAMKIERGADDIARCFALEQLLYERGFEQIFDGEVTGLISAGAFVSFGAVSEEGERQDPTAYEGMLPVRVLRAPTGEDDQSLGRGRRGRQSGGGRGHERESSREWWELNEQGTILQGERTGATLRLADPVQVRVARVDTVRGRVDLLPAG